MEIDVFVALAGLLFPSSASALTLWDWVVHPWQSIKNGALEGMEKALWNTATAILGAIFTLMGKFSS